MILKMTPLSTVAATTTIVLSSFLASAPAEALSLKGDFNFGGSVKISGSPSNYKFDFLSELPGSPNSSPGTAGDISIGTSSGSFAGATEVGAGAKIKDFSTGTPAAGFPTPFIKDFITGIRLSPGPSPVLSFDLTDFDDFAQIVATGANSFGINAGGMKGFFRDTTGTVVSRGSLSAQFSTDNLTGVTTYSGSLNAVPTPALLPGLVGMGVAALRKRKSLGAEETVES